MQEYYNEIALKLKEQLTEIRYDYLPYVYKRRLKWYKEEKYMDYMELMSLLAWHIDDIGYVVMLIRETIDKNIFNWTNSRVYYNILYMLDRSNLQDDLRIKKYNLIQRIKYAYYVLVSKKPTICDPKDEYANAKWWISTLLKEEAPIEKKIRFLKDIQTVITNDIIYSSYTTMIYGSDNCFVPIPEFMQNKFTVKTVNIADCLVVSKPRFLRYFFDNIKYDKVDFDPEAKDVREGYYIEQLNMLFVQEGKHHAERCKVENGSGKFYAYTINLDDFIGLDSDGEKWFYKDQTYAVNDFRLALLFWCYFEEKELESRKN